MKIHSSGDFVDMRAAGKLAAETLDMIYDYVVPGVTTEKLNQVCHDFILANNAIPAPLNYRGFPKSICTSINHVICHGIPSDRKLKDGDILNIDVTVILNGWYGDSSRMYCAGDTSIKAYHLMEITYEAMMAGIRKVKPGATLGDVGEAIQSWAEHHRYSVVTDFGGHGIGREFHAPPQIVHVGKKGEGLVLKEGMFFTIEPMINIGKKDCKSLADDWTIVTRDKSLSAQYEHTIAVTDDGYEIFTLSPKQLHMPHRYPVGGKNPFTSEKTVDTETA